MNLELEKNIFFPDRRLSGKMSNVQNLVAVLSVLLVSLVSLLVSSLLGLPTNTLLALSIFLAEISATLLLWDNRLSVAFIGVSLLILTGSLTLESFLKYANLDVIFFLAAMMILVGILEERGFFDSIVSLTIWAAGGNGLLLYAVIILLSFALAAVIDEVTSIVIMIFFVLSLARQAQVNPIPLTLACIFATNIGSSATPIGNPVGVLIAFRAGLSFEEFLRWSLPISFLNVGLLFVLSMHFLRDELRDFVRKISLNIKSEGFKTYDGFLVDAALFLLTLVFLAIHHQLEYLLGLEKNSMLLAIPFISTGISIIVYPQSASRALRERVEWPTLLFFTLLFASVGSLKSTGFIDYLSRIILENTGSSLLENMVLMTTLTSMISPLMDNVIAVSLLLPVVESLGKAGLRVYPLYWVMLHSAVISGNLTPIGSTANIVALGLLERSGYRKPSLTEWLRHGWLATLPPLIVSFTLLSLQANLMP